MSVASPTISPTVVSVQGASKRFVIHKEKSLKERVVNMGRSRKHKDDFWALRDIDVTISSGSTVGLIGPNGSGKSTLLKLIGGILQPTTGTVEHRGRLAALLELGAGFHPDLTGRENVFLNASILGLSRKQTEQYFDGIVEFSGIEQFIDTQVKFYSSGMYVRLAFAVAVHVDPDILLVDEVLAVGDEPFQRKCMDRIRQFQNEGRTIILVTHALDQVADLCDRAIVLEHGVIQLDGPPREALRHLRADFDTMRQEEIESQRDRERIAAPTAQAAAEVSTGTITSVRLHDAAGAPVMTIAPGGALLVTIEAKLDGLVDDPVFGIGIETPLGQVVYGTNTKLMGIKLRALSGPTSVTFRLPELWLGEGQYTLQAAVAREGGVELTRTRDAATLTVHAQGRNVGFVYTDAELVAGP